jgi:hypothetical protein
MRRPRRSNRSLVFALYLNAAMLLGIVVLLLSRGGLGSQAIAAPTQTPPIAGGGGVFLMPGQLSISTWGCYLMDIDAQTLCAYEYIPGEKSLRFVAARNFRYDRQLKRYNTTPNPEEIKQRVELEKNGVRGRDEPPPPASDGNGDKPTPPAPAGESGSPTPPSVVIPGPPEVAPDSRPGDGKTDPKLTNPPIDSDKGKGDR